MDRPCEWSWPEGRAISMSEKWLRPVLNGFEQLCLPNAYRAITEDPFLPFWVAFIQSQLRNDHEGVVKR